MVHSGYVRPGGGFRTLSVERINRRRAVVESIGRRRIQVAGFTLIELTVVVGIIGILLAVAIPLLLGAQQNAKDASAKAKASTALKAQREIAADGNGYGDSIAVEAAEPTLNALPLPDGTEAVVQGVVYIRDVSESTVTIVARSASNTCFWVKQEVDRVLYAKGGCDADDVDSLTFGTRW
jgi:type IV pilus assembly protein PilA